MKNKSLTVTVIFLMCTVLLAGCGKDKDNSDISDKLKEKAAAASEKEEEEKTTDPSKNRASKDKEAAQEKEPEEEEIKGVPELLLFRQNAYEWGEDNTAAIEHHYTYLMLDGESAQSNRALAASLEDARDEMLSMQSEAWEKDLKSIEENKLITFDESWKVYLRRTDEEYLSFVTEYCGEGLFDDGAYTEYTAHTYRVDSGKEIALSEVIADEDAFYDILSEKMYESINSSLQQYYSTDLADDKETFKDDLKNYMKSGELAWTLDPFGVTCYLQAYIKSPFAESAVIQFSEDTKHTIFTDEFRESAKDEYVIQVPGYVGSYIDINDSGVPVYVDASEFYDYSETYDDMELSGMHLSCAGDWKNIPMTMPGGTDYYNIFLIHKDGSTVVLESHDEYDTSFINTCKLARHEVDEADSIRGCLEWASEKDYDIDGEGYTPVYVPSDPSGIRVLTGDGDYAQDWSPAVINVDTKGNIEVSTDTADKSDKTDGSADTAEDTEEENPYDGGPDWVTLADEFVMPTNRMCIEDAVEEYSVSLYDGGRYHDYEGDIGDVIPEYKDRDLDGDHKPDVIRREGRHYVFELTRKGTFKTDDYSASPNEGEVIQFQDLACRNFDEIEIVHYTFGTGGPSVSDTTVYSWQDGKWKAFPVIDKDGVIDSSMLQDYIAKETGKPYDAGSVRVADVKMGYLLLDLGSKDGPSQTMDYRTSYLCMNFNPEYLAEGDYDCAGLSADMGLVRSWPFEVTGDPVKLTSDLQRKLNVFLSNFSEQNFTAGTWPLDYAHFALEWSKINDPSLISIKNNRYRISHSDLNGILQKYMKTNLQEGDFDDIEEDNPYQGTSEYDEGKIWYTEPAADGEMYKNNRFSVVKDVQKVTAGRSVVYRAEFEVFSLDTDEYDKNGISKKYYALGPDEADKLMNSGKLYHTSYGLAFLRDGGEDGYSLEYYNVFGD
ncbi:MAG: hypothetical protein K6G27_07315 [Lachnospiraceae bacterium]|nr:hypothetical protein [Lachnospiraceae bacterium]